MNLAVFSTNFRFLGLSQTANGTASGLYMGSDGTNQFDVALWKLDGSTWTQLAAENASSLTFGPQNIDMHVVNFGASATVTVYVGGNLRITYTGSTNTHKHFYEFGTTHAIKSDSAEIPLSAQGGRRFGC